MGKRGDIAPKSDYMVRREDFILPVKDGADEVTGLRDVTTLYTCAEDEQIIELEVLKHYMGMIVEKSGQRQLKLINLRTDKVSTHYFDSHDEVCPINHHLQEFFDVTFEDNLTFESNSLSYRLSSPTRPAQIFNYQATTKKASECLFMEQISNLIGEKSNLLCEKINIPTRDGTEIPIVTVYDQRHYSEESPWILFTSGVDSQKHDLAL